MVYRDIRKLYKRRWFCRRISFTKLRRQRTPPTARLLDHVISDDVVPPLRPSVVDDDDDDSADGDDDVDGQFRDTRYRSIKLTGRHRCGRSPLNCRGLLNSHADVVVYRPPREPTTECPPQSGCSLCGGGGGDAAASSTMWTRPGYCSDMDDHPDLIDTWHRPQPHFCSGAPD